MNSIFSDPVRKKKFFILICGVMILFVTSMAKVLVPATIFEDLLAMNMDVNRIATLGSAFLYSYAASQLLMGCFSDRYGGVRILLIGGGLFTTGTLGFPLVENYALMIVFRIFTGFGAGTIFLGVAKLLGDLFPEHFGFALGAVLFFSYLGPTTGTVPMVKLVEIAGWQTAMFIPGIAALCPLLIILLLMRGTTVPVRSGQTFDPLLIMLKNKHIWFISFACATVYGSYYALVGQIGQKIFTDIYGFAAGKAALCIMLLTIIVAVNNMTGNLMLKLCGGRRKTVILIGVILSALGIGAAECGFLFNSGSLPYLIGTILIAVPAGLFPMFSTVAKELNPPEYTAMSVAFINFMAFVFISTYQNIAGAILESFPRPEGVLAFSQSAYETVFHFFAIGAVVSFIAALLVKETGKNKNLQQQI